jgi:hypothetical protein
VTPTISPQHLGQLTRRQLVQVGAIGALFNLPGLLRASSPYGTPKRSGLERSCIFIFQQGGLSQIDSWDPKPSAPDNTRGPYKPIATSVPGFQVGELMPRLAQLAGRYAVIRSMTHREQIHDSAMAMSLSGKSEPPRDGPYYGSVLSKVHPTPRGMPSYVCLVPIVGDKRTYQSPGFLGAAHAPMVVGSVAHHPATPGFRVTDFDSPHDVPRERIASRQKLVAGVDARQPAFAGSAGGEYQKFQEKAFELVTGPAARQAFDLERESPRLRERYGHNPLGQNLLLARRLTEAGVRLVCVNAFTGLTSGSPPTLPQVWDMHGGQYGSIFGSGGWGLGFALPRADAAVSTLLEDLDVRGLLQRTLVVMVGEFGRTPTISGSPPGRDHHAPCYSAMLAGAGIRGGAVYGASDQLGGAVKDRPVSLEDFSATMYHALGLAPDTGLSRPDGFTQHISNGQPVEQLFG